MGIRERVDCAASMPHRAYVAAKDQLDARLASVLGRLFFSGEIDRAEFLAGEKYGEIALAYLQSIEAPSPYGGEVLSLLDDDCFKRKIRYAQAVSILREAGKGVSCAVDRVVVYDEEIRSPAELKSLVAGLSALAGLPLPSEEGASRDWAARAVASF